MSEVIMVSPTSGDALEMKAEMLLKQFQPGALKGEEPTDAEKIFEIHLFNMGIDTRYEDLSALPGGRVLGFTYSDGKQKTCLVDVSLLEPGGGRRGRLRATIGHEVAHALLHLPELHQFRSLCSEKALAFCRCESSRIKLYRNPEWQAWRYAGALLMPRNIFRPLAESGMNVRNLAERFDVNPAFVRSRKKQLKIPENGGETFLW